MYAVFLIPLVYFYKDNNNIKIYFSNLSRSILFQASEVPWEGKLWTLCH